MKVSWVVSVAMASLQVLCVCVSPVQAGTLAAWLTSIDSVTGKVTVNGVDTGQLSGPFTWEWGDGNVEDGWFPMQHTYADVMRNYILVVTSHYEDGTTDQVEVIVRFTEVSISPVELWDKAEVSIPESVVELESRMPGYRPSSEVTFMPQGCFPVTPRETLEYVLSVAAVIQLGFVEGDVVYPEGTFHQVVLNDPRMTGGMYSLWYTRPVAFAASCNAMQGTIQYSSFFHEMGHNVTLNFPAAYHYGGKIDGNANAIYSETMAQIFQYATAWEMESRAGEFGLGEELIADIMRSDEASSSFRASVYERYIASGCDFCSWNDPKTTGDETFDSFMTAAHQFNIMATEAGLGMRVPMRRLCRFLGHFNPDWHAGYGQRSNTVEAEQFRATLLVTAFSYALGKDVRDVFATLRFHIDNGVYADLMETVVRAPCNGVGLVDGDMNGDCRVDLADIAIVSANWLECNMVPQAACSTETPATPQR